MSGVLHEEKSIWCLKFHKEFVQYFAKPHLYWIRYPSDINLVNDMSKPQD